MSDPIIHKSTAMDNQTKHYGWGKRQIFIFMSFCLMVMNQCWRNNLSVAIVAMVKQGNMYSKKNQNNMDKK